MICCDEINKISNSQTSIVKFLMYYLPPKSWVTIPSYTCCAKEKSNKKLTLEFLFPFLVFYTVICSVKKFVDGSKKINWKPLFSLKLVKFCKFLALLWLKLVDGLAWSKICNISFILWFSLIESNEIRV